MKTIILFLAFSLAFVNYGCTYKEVDVDEEYEDVEEDDIDDEIDEEVEEEIEEEIEEEY